MSTRVRAWVGTILFLFVAPGIVAGLIPWLITGYRMPDRGGWVWPVAIVAGLVILGGVLVLLDAFIRFALEVLTNDYMNGETIRFDGAIRMPPA